MEFCYKVYRVQKDTLLAVCDADIVGRVLDKDGLDIEIKENFYSDEKCGSRKIMWLSREATIINAVGRNIVDLLIKEGLVDGNNVLKVKGVPMAQMVKI